MDQIKDLEEPNFSVIDAEKKQNAQIVQIIQGNITKMIPTLYRIKINKDVFKLSQNQFYERRFNDFYNVHQEMKKKYPYIVLPAIPQKSLFKDQEVRKIYLEQFLNKILTIKNLDQYEPFYIKKNDVVFEDNKTVKMLRKRLSSLTGFIKPFLSNQQNEKVDLLQDKTEMDQIKMLKESITQQISLIEEVISSKRKIQNSSNENQQAFKNLEKSFEQFAEDLGQQQSEEQFKKTLNMFSNNFQRTSHNFQEITSESNQNENLLNYLLEDIKELKSSIENFKDYREKIDNMTQQQYQVNQQSTEETLQEYKLKLKTFIKNLESANKNTSQEKKQIMENDLNKLMKSLFKIQNEWKDQFISIRNYQIQFQIYNKFYDR